MSELWLAFLTTPGNTYPKYIGNGEDALEAQVVAENFTIKSPDHKPLKNNYWAEQRKGVTAITYTQPVLLTNPTPRKRFAILVVRKSI